MNGNEFKRIIFSITESNWLRKTAENTQILESGEIKEVTVHKKANYGSSISYFQIYYPLHSIKNSITA